MASGSSKDWEKNCRERWAIQRKGTQHLFLKQCQRIDNHWEHHSLVVSKFSINSEWRTARNFKLKLCPLEGYQVHLLVIKGMPLYITNDI